MEFLLNRFRNLTVLLVVVVAQLILIAYQVRTEKDVPLLRVWAVTAFTPLEQLLEVVRRNTWGFVADYFVLINTRAQNDRLQKELGQLKLENHFLRTELSTADRAKALAVFQTRSPSKTLAARIIGNGTGANSKAVFIDRGSGDGVESGMAVVTPDGIVGKITAAYPTASLLLLITDANFAAGIISQKNHVRGTLKGQGHDGTVLVDYVQNEEKIEVGELFFTSGDDRIFPKGFPVGPVSAVRNGRLNKEIYLNPSGFQGGLEEVLVVLDAVHQRIPEMDVASPRMKLIPGPPDSPDGPVSAEGQSPSTLITDADRLKQQYKQAGDLEHHTFGQGTAPDFTRMPGLREPGPTAAKQTPQLETPPPLALSKPAGDAQTPPHNPPAKSRPAATPLVTDPTDADPSEPAVAPQIKRAEPALDEFGQPKKPKPRYQ
jgi:rod shape-determining protein MreC